MIHKMRINPLQNFKTIKPSTNLRHCCVFTVGHRKMHFNMAVFNHFHGWKYFKLGLNGHKLAITNTSTNDPDGFEMPLRTNVNGSKNYEGFFNKNIYDTITKKLLHKDLKHSRMTFIAPSRDVFNNCIIFDLSKPA